MFITDPMERAQEHERLTALRAAAWERAENVRARLERTDYDATTEDERELRAALDEAEQYHRKIEAMNEESRESLRQSARDGKLVPAGRQAERRRLDDDDPSGVILRSDQRLADYVPATREQRNLRFGAFIRGYVTGDWTGADAEKRAMSTSGASALIPAPVAAEFIDRARNAMQTNRAGIRTVRMDAATLKVPRLTGSSGPAWRNEAAAIATGDLAVDAVTLTARSLAFRVTLSRELVSDSDPSALELISHDLAAQVALEIDRVVLRGTGTAPEPRGIRNTTGITTATVGTGNGDPVATSKYAPLLTAQAAVRGLNFEPNAYLMHPRQFGALAALYETGAGYVQPPAALADMRGLPTAQIPVNLTVGTSADCTELYVCQWNLVYLGWREEPAMFQLAELSAGTGQVDLIIHARADVAVAQPGAMYVVLGQRG
jgi:HK97 family phage major capsid protein